MLVTNICRLQQENENIAFVRRSRKTVKYKGLIFVWKRGTNLVISLTNYTKIVIISGNVYWQPRTINKELTVEDTCFHAFLYKDRQYEEI